tara:strand:- start:5905 stop:6852 length:948 start_codon:yes stop_codon:yes gene_type:complete
MSKIPSDAELLQMMTELSNWGRWGPEDQLGCLNLITSKKVVEASALVSRGVTISCARPITTDPAADVTYQVQRFMVDSGEGRATDTLERQINRKGAAEFIGMVFHGQTITHIDALSHYSWRGLMYNGVPADMVTAKEGAESHSIEPTGSGIVTRGVLLDIARLKNKKWLSADEPVFPEDLDAAEAKQGIQVREGDIVLIHTGNYERRLSEGAVDSTQPMTACQVACARWFRNKGIAMLGTDTSNDIRPTHYPEVTTSPMHIMCLVTMGLWLIDNCNLMDLSEYCYNENIYEFMLSLGPLKLNKVTGSPVNPIAIF